MALQLAIVGVGWAGRRQAQAIRELKGTVELVALVDNDADHLAFAAVELGVAHHTTDFDSILADPAIDAVSICTPHPLHAPVLPLSLIQSSETKLPGNLGGYTVYGVKGSLRAGKEAAEYFANDAEDAHKPQMLAYPKADMSEYAQEIAAFARAVAGDGTGLTDGRSERRSLAVVEAGYASMTSGEAVVLAQRFGKL